MVVLRGGCGMGGIQQGMRASLDLFKGCTCRPNTEWDFFLGEGAVLCSFSSQGVHVAGW